MSSHREAPEISKDPVADNTDVYAFVSPDRPDTVTLIANFIPLQEPAGGPNFFEFGEDVLYSIHVDNDGDGVEDISFEFRFDTRVRNGRTFLYNTGPIQSLDSPNWNRRQLMDVRAVQHWKHGRCDYLGNDLRLPPCNIGPLSTPKYAALADDAVHDLGHGIKVFAGQRAEGFYVDLGAIFDLLDLRPFADLHTTFGLKGLPGRKGDGVNTTKNLNVHTIAIQVPTRLLTRDGRTPTDATKAASVLGVWSSASRRKVTIRSGYFGDPIEAGPWVQVSRLGNPLVNEVIIPMGTKDYWNVQEPRRDRQFSRYYSTPEVATLLPVLYPGVFPKLAAYQKPRADLLAILLTGIPAGVVPGFQNYTGAVQADMLRLNAAVQPAKKPSIYGLLGRDPAGFPNGRRVADDVVAIELRAIAGVTIPLVDPSFTPDAAASIVDDGVTPKDLTVPYLDRFPYLGVPHSGFFTPAA